LEAPIRRVAARKLVSAIRAGTGPDERPFDIGASNTLYQAIFTPDVAALTAKAKLLTVSSDDLLSALPFSLLATRPAESVADAHWLIEDKAIAVAPSIAAMESPEGKDRNPKGGFVGIGAPSLSGSAPVTAGPSYFAAGETRYDRLRSMPPLPQARIELTNMARLWGRRPGTRLLMRDDATEAALRALDLTHLSVLAFATYGLVAGEFDAVSEPALVLTPRPSADAPAEDDGLLTASEAALLNIDADWIILSACNTAAGDRPSAAGYTGLARAFLFAGGRRVMASHWPVRDDVSARLMLATVRGAARGKDPAEALRQAMLALMRDPSVKGARNPAVWAPFMLVGR
jgi:CHAT domain-containing protein